MIKIFPTTKLICAFVPLAMDDLNYYCPLIPFNVFMKSQANYNMSCGK